MQRVDILDANDPRLEDYRDLTDVALRRRIEPAGGLYIAESAKVIARALGAGHRPRSVLTQQKWIDDLAPLLAQHPDIADGIRDEVARVVGDGPVTAAHIGELDLTGRTFDESLRLYPPIWVTGRNALEDDVIEGVPVPKGRLLFIHTWGIHRHPDLWDRPLVFDPDRFLPEAKARIPRGAYHPFTMGHRKCIGDRFARTEGIALLATILRRIDVALGPGQVAVPEPTLTLRPRGGLHMTVTPRPRGL